MVQEGFQDAFDAVQTAASLADEEVRAAWRHPVVRLTITVNASAPGTVNKSKLASLQASLSGKKQAPAPSQAATGPSAGLPYDVGSHMLPCTFECHQVKQWS